MFKPKNLISLGKMTYAQWGKDKVPRMAAALAYYTIFSLAPLLIITISIAGLVFGQKAAQGEIVAQIQGMIGADSAKAIEAMLQSAAQKPAPGLLASIVGIFTLLLGSRGSLCRASRRFEYNLECSSAREIRHLEPGQKSTAQFQHGRRYWVSIVGFAAPQRRPGRRVKILWRILTDFFGDSASYPCSTRAGICSICRCRLP
jgi:hypothetical protein